MNSKDRTRRGKSKSSFVNPEQRAKAVTTREQTRAMMRDLNIGSKLNAIRQYCLDCTGGSTEAVRRCGIASCHVWPYRFGRNPKASDLQVPIADDSGNIVGYREYRTYPVETSGGGKAK